MLKSLEQYPHMVQLRRWFHQYPELAFEEVKTAEHIIGELTRLGVAHRYQGKGHSVIGELVNEPGKPFVVLRAEMDALPGDEMTGAGYRSRNPGKMHACGHGAHMAMVLGAAATLVEKPPPGSVRFVFQPAEENGGGARTAIEDGALEDAVAIYAGHVTHDYEPGIIMIRDGVMTAQSDRFVIDIVGKGGHAARPHEATDAVLVAGMLITAVQSLVSRETNPLHPTVVTIGKINAGTAANVIASSAHMEGSIRTTQAQVRQHIHNGLERMGSAAAELYDAAVRVSITEGYPPVVNTLPEAKLAREVAVNVLGPDCLREEQHPSMGSEDFSYYLEKLPGCFARFGARPEGCEPVPLHHPAFDIDEEVLKVGAAYFDEVARRHLAQLDASSDSATTQ